MKISVICLAKRSNGAAGFSLIEIMVVMLLMGLLSAVIAPRMTTMYASFKYKSQIDEIKSAVQNASLYAYANDETLVLSDYILAQGVLPEEWALRPQGEPIIIKENGVCLGGNIELRSNKRSSIYHVRPPFCRMDFLSDAES